MTKKHTWEEVRESIGNSVKRARDYSGAGWAAVCDMCGAASISSCPCEDILTIAAKVEQEAKREMLEECVELLNKRTGVADVDFHCGKLVAELLSKLTKEQ